MIENVISQRKMKTRNLNVNISQDSWGIQLICQGSGKIKPIGMMKNSNKFLSFAIHGAQNCMNG